MNRQIFLNRVIGLTVADTPIILNMRTYKDTYISQPYKCRHYSWCPPRLLTLVLLCFLWSATVWFLIERGQMFIDISEWRWYLLRLIAYHSSFFFSPFMTLSFAAFKQWFNKDKLHLYALFTLPNGYCLFPRPQTPPQIARHLDIISILKSLVQYCPMFFLAFFLARLANFSYRHSRLLNLSEAEKLPRTLQKIFHFECSSLELKVVGCPFCATV